MSARGAGLGLLVLLTVWCVWASALQPDLPDRPTGVSVGPQEIWEDVTGTTTWSQVRHGAFAFEPVGDGIPNYGYSSSTFWMRLTVVNRTSTPRPLYASVAGALLDDVRVFVVSPDGRVQTSRTGSTVPGADRPVPEAARLMLLPFEAAAGESVQVYLRLRTPSGVSSFPVQIIDERAAHADAAADSRSHGILLGIFGSLFAYNVLLWSLLRDPVYSTYTGYLACTFAVSSIINGNGATFFYPHHTWPTQHLVVPMGALSIWFVLRFTRLFLQIVDHPRLELLLRTVGTFTLLLGAFDPLLPRPWTMSAISTLVSVIPVLCVGTGVVVWRAGKAQARFYLAGNLCGVAALVVMTGLTIGVSPVTRATAMAFSYGTAADGVLLAFALADRIRVLQRAQARAERREQAALASRAEELERLVAERTAEIERMAVTDSLTGAANRHGFDRASARIDALQTQNPRPYAVLMIDLDDFKSINDRFGHDEGDRVLREVARTISALLVPRDVFCRLGGEEFVVIRLDATAEQARPLAERLRSAIAASVMVGHPPRSVTTSIGVAAGSTSGPYRLNQVRREADAALYRAKEQGRNRVVLFSSGEHADTADAVPAPATERLATLRSAGEHGPE